MNSVVDVTKDDAVSIALIEAMAALDADNDDFLEKFVGKPPMAVSCVNVKMQINGVEVDFIAAADGMFKRLLANYERHVLEKAQKLVNSSRLEKLRDILWRIESDLERSEWQVNQELEKLYKEGGV